MIPQHSNQGTPAPLIVFKFMKSLANPPLTTAGMAKALQNIVVPSAAVGLRPDDERTAGLAA